jgi:hypothetical protein
MALRARVLLECGLGGVTTPSSGLSVELCLSPPGQGEGGGVLGVRRSFATPASKQVECEGCQLRAQALALSLLGGRGKGDGE